MGRWSALALELVREGTEVMAIDARRETVQRMAGKLTHIVAADSTDIEALRELGVTEFGAPWSRSARTCRPAS